MYLEGIIGQKSKVDITRLGERRVLHQPAPETVLFGLG
jgi:hypothetical protein